MKAPQRVLVIVTRRIGDVLLATPLIHSLRLAWPQSELDALVFEGTQGILANNPDIGRVLTIAARPGVFRHAGLIERIARHYDIALSLVPGDRPTLYACIAGKRSIGLATPARKHAWNRRLLDEWVEFDDLDTHTLRMHLKLAERLGVAPHSDVIMSWRAEDEERAAAQLKFDWKSLPFAVLHCHPKFNYKMWHEQGWIDLAKWLSAQGLRVVLSGGGDEPELAYVRNLAARMPSALSDASGRLSFSELAAVLSRARIYAGPDTVVTHMAAALGTPTVALFGPSNPVKWGPWPKGHPAERNPWTRLGTQIAGNVVLVQGPGACVPCLLEGCDRRIESFSDCLLALPARLVIEAAARALGLPRSL